MRPAALALSLLLLACRDAPAAPAPSSPMPTEKTTSLPFGLTADDLATVEVSSAYYSSKSGAGMQRIAVRGTGAVVLERTMNYKAPVEERAGSVPAGAVRALLALFEEERFIDLPERIEASGPHATRVLILKIGERTTRVALAGGHSVAFERLAAAVKVVAAQAVPEAVGHTFFPNL